MSSEPHVTINMSEHKPSTQQQHENNNHNHIKFNNVNDPLRSPPSYDQQPTNHHNNSNGQRVNSPNRISHRTQRDLESAVNDAEPLLETDLKPQIKPPLAGPEIDEEVDDDDPIPNTPDYHPGVDDGFFPADPSIGPRIGGDDESDGNGTKHTNNKPPSHLPPPDNEFSPRRPSVSSNFPYAPGFGPGIMTEVNGNPVIIPDINIYQHKKTLAQGMMDLALLSANANQLRYVLESYARHPYYYFSIVFISLSLLLQVAVGVGLVWNSRYNVKDEKHICIADKINNFTVLGIFLITIVNVFISSFGVADPPSTMRN